jgi:hypothetical protein
MFLFALLVEVALYQPKQSVSKILFQRPKAYVAEPLPFFFIPKAAASPQGAGSWSSGLFKSQ